MLVQDYLRKFAEECPDKKAVICSNHSYSYGRLFENSQQLARYLVNTGIQRQERVLIFMDNSPEIIISMYAALQAGAVFVIPSATMKSKKLSYILKDSAPSVLITHACKARIVIEALSDPYVLQKIIWCSKGEIPKGLQTQISKLKVESAFWRNVLADNTYTEDTTFPTTLGNDLATIIYTSGSTGEPKGVMSTHHNIEFTANSIISYLNNTEDDIILCALPLSFDYGLYQVIMAFMFGGTVVLEQSFVFPYPVLERIDTHKVTGFPIVPTMLSLLYELNDVSKFRFQSLRYITNTAASLSPAHIKRFNKYWPHVTVFSMYGLTECKRVSYVPPEDLARKMNSVGIPIPGVETFIIDKDGREVKPGEVGELVVRGPNVMQGYWRSPEETQQKFVNGRYRDDIHLFTGDYFKKDEEGFLYFVSRKDDLIKTKGERISPKEIENTLMEMEGVLAVAVVGVPDRISGQVIRANVVLADINITEKQVLNFCKHNLEPFMVPQHIHILDALPYLPNGKIDKTKLMRSGNSRRSNSNRRNAIIGKDATHLTSSDRRILADRRYHRERRVLSSQQM